MKAKEFGLINVFKKIIPKSKLIITLRFFRNNHVFLSGRIIQDDHFRFSI